MKKAFRDKRSTWWILGVAAAAIGLFVAYVVLPASAPTKGADGVQIDVPRMENVPPPSSRMKLDVDEK